MPKGSARRNKVLHRPFRIGLTGGIGSGKSRVLTLLAQMGIPTLQTDWIGHALLKKPSIQKKLKGLWDTGIVSVGGRVDRRELGRKVFQDPRKRSELNHILHPLIRQEVSTWSRTQAKRRPFPPLIVVEVPLLFEGGYHRWFDGTVSVSAPRKVRHKRLASRGWSLLEIRQREAAQWSQGKKDLAADRVIYNRGSLKCLKWSVEDWLRKVSSKR